MINMIKADIYRITKSPVFYIAIGIVLIMLAVSIAICQPGALGTANMSLLEDKGIMSMNIDELNKMSFSDMRNFMMSLDGYKLDKEILAMNMNLYYIFIFILVVVVSTDFSVGSVKNTLSYSIKRSRYFISKSVISLIVCIIFFFANCYLAYFLNRIINGEKLSSDIETITRICIMQLPVIIAISAMLTGLAFMIRRNSIYCVITFTGIMIYQFASQLLTNVFGVSKVITKYELQAMIMTLSSDPSVSYIRNSYIACGILSVVFLTTGWLMFKKAEIK